VNPPATKSTRTAYTVVDLTDHRLDLQELSLLERGTYETLRLIYLEQAQPLPADMTTLLRLVGATDRKERQAVASVLAKRFTLVDGCYRNKRCDQELSRIAQKRQAQQMNGKAGAEVRWGSNYGQALAKNSNEVLRNKDNEGNERNTRVEQSKPLPSSNTHAPPEEDGAYIQDGVIGSEYVAQLMRREAAERAAGS
jgi:uncharacterized protein YdaU (DUF1376 family)